VVPRDESTEGDDLADVPGDDPLLVHGDPSTLDTRALADINQAIGVLIDRGFLPDEALAELQRLSKGSERHLHEAALQVLRSLKPPATNT
jgi:hypothetical protein